MREMISLLSEAMNRIHDAMQSWVGVAMSDKELHFFVVGMIGMLTFFALFVLVKIIQQLKFSTTIIAFIFAFILMVVFVFAIEIQQAVTQSGNMEFADAVAGLWGFIVFFIVYAVIAGAFYGLFKFLRWGKRSTSNRKPKKARKKKSRPLQSAVYEEPKDEELKVEEQEPIKYRSDLRK